MSFLPSFTAWQFALAGAICAAGPLIIHLLNRRRFRVVHWAAMPFLREALQRNRKMMQLRDIILLVLRTAAVLLFGFALARPFVSVGAEDFDRSRPLHAILVFDNSLSMGYSQVDGTLLDKAKDRAKTFIEELPEGSLVTVIPLCGTAENISRDPYPFKDKGLLAAIDAIEVVDRDARVQRAVNEANKAKEAAPELAKRVVFFSDQQRGNWSDTSTGERFKELGALQVVDVGPAEWDNAWISDLRVQDGLADVSTPTTFVVELKHKSSQSSAAKSIQVSLYVNGEMLPPKAVSLGGSDGLRQVTFEHLFSTLSPAEGQPELVPVKAVISADNLAADNERHLIVPVVASLPVLFIDQYSDEEEDPLKGRLGETRHVRRLIAPLSSRDEMKRQLINVRHMRLTDLTQSDLEDARLVVMAGVQSPESESTVQLLRDYVSQGGQLVLAAGADFDPRAWTELAWLDGAGILPAPLAGQPIGRSLDEITTDVSPYFLSYESLGSHYYFQLPDTNEKQRRETYSKPAFFKFVEADVSPETLDKLKQAESERLEKAFASLAALESQAKDLAQKNAAGELDEAGRKQLSDAEMRLRAARPQWLRWQQPEATEELPADPAERARRLAVLASATVPQTRARFTSQNGPPFLIERKIGRGHVLFFTSGLYSTWNTLPLTDTVFLYDRILRSLIHETLVQRNYPAVERVDLILPVDDRDTEISLRRPERENDPEPLEPGFIGQERGVTVLNPLARGLYRVSGAKPAISATDRAASEEQWTIPFTVNGDASESDLSALPRDLFDEWAVDSDVRWVAPGDAISLAGVQISGQNSWQYLIFAVLLLLLGELALLAWPTLKAGWEDKTTQATGGAPPSSVPATPA